MKTKEELEKELRALEAKIRNKRLTLQDLDSECARKTDKKIGLETSIVDAQREKGKIIRGYDDTIKKLLDEIVSQKSTLKEFKDAQAKLKERQNALDRDRQGVEAFREEVSKNEKKNTDRAVQLKSDKIALAKTEKELTAAIARQEGAIDNLVKATEKHNRMNEEFDKEMFGIAEMESQASKNLGETKTIKAEYDAKLKAVAEGRATLDRDTHNQALQAKKLEDDKKALKVQRVAANDVKDLYNRKLAGISGSYAELDKAKDAFEVKRLRLEKAQRDGTIKDELARLRKELNK